MKDLLATALQSGMDNGAEFVESRLEEQVHESIVVRNGKVEIAAFSSTIGLGVRTLVKGAWGFCATNELTPEAIAHTARNAVEIGRASAAINNRAVKLAPIPVVEDTWYGQCRIDPFSRSLSEKVDYLLKCDALMRKDKRIKVAEGEMNFYKLRKWYANSEGSSIYQEIPLSGAGIKAVAIDKGDMQVRSYPTSFGGQFQGSGYELLEQWPLIAHAERIANEAVALLTAPPCPSGRMTIVLESSQLALQIHESCGHATELDRVLGSEINDYGTSFLTPDKRGSFQYGSPIVTIVADPTCPGGLGSFGYDDEGVPAVRTELVKNGLFVDYLTSRETAPIIGNERSNASMRAENYNRIPLIRMTNVNLEPGAGSFEDLIADIDDGLYLSTNKSFSIDDRRWQFQFGTEIGYRIKKGKLAEIVKNPVYSGVTPQFWNSCEAICGKDEWVLWGIPNCGKGQPDQSMKVSHGCAPSRFTNVQVGYAG